MQAYRKLLNKVDNYYFSNVTTEHDKAKQFVNMISDLNMVTPIDRAVKTQAKHSKRSTYYYQCVFMDLYHYAHHHFVKQ